MEGAIEVEMKAGDALIFVDASVTGRRCGRIQAPAGSSSIATVLLGGTSATATSRHPSSWLDSRPARQILRSLQLLPRELNRQS
jgi:hypothetical protein